MTPAVMRKSDFKVMDAAFSTAIMDLTVIYFTNVQKHNFPSNK